jgi:predicted  nucleic acid-binding Zn-ribbon protein
LYPEGSAAVSVVQPLLDLQDIDGRIRDLQQEIRDIPQRKAQEQERLNGAREVLARAQAELRNAKLRVNEAELEVQARREKIQALKQNQVSLKTNKEFQIYNLEIARIEGEIESYEARQVAAMDDVIPVKHRVAEAEAKLRNDQSLVDGYVAELDERLAVVQTELTATEAERAESAKQVTPQFILYYERLRTKRWPVVVSLGSDCVCNGCHLVQPPSVGQMVRRNQGIVACQMCGRILYRAQ